MTAALAWPTRVVVLAGNTGQLLRGRPAEFRQRGLSLSEAHGALDALASLGRDPASAVVVPADRRDEDAGMLVEAVQSLTGTPVILGVREAGELDGWRPILTRSHVRVIDLPMTPATLTKVLGTLGRGAVPPAEVLRCGELELNAGEHRALWHGALVRLPPRPFDVLEILMEEHPRVVRVSEFLERLNVARQPAGNALGVRSAMKIIRQELRAAAPGRPIPIESVRGVGYGLIA